MESFVVGEALIDIVGRGGDRPVERVGGSPTNVAVGLARLQVPVTLLTMIARDDRGSQVSRWVERSGGRLDERSFAAERTSTARAILADDGSARYEFDLSWDPGHFTIPDVGLVHTGSLAAFMEPGASRVIEAVSALNSDTIVSFDPNIRSSVIGPRTEAVARAEMFFARADVVKLSDEDAAWLYPRRDIREVCDRVLDLGADMVAVTRGEKGALMACANGRVSIDAPRVAVADTVGAGDSFMAALLFAISRDPQVVRDPDLQRLRAAAGISVRAASLTVQRVGADLPWISELVDTL